MKAPNVGFVTQAAIVFLVVVGNGFLPEAQSAFRFSVLQDEDGYRTWTDRSGNTLEAKFVEIEGLDVKLEKKDGEVVSISMSQLSHDDRRAAMEAKSKKVFGDMGDRFGGFDDDSDEDFETFGRRDKKETSFDSSNHKLIQMDFSEVREIKDDAKEWSLNRPPITRDADWDHTQSFSMDLTASFSNGILFDPRFPSRGYVKTKNVGSETAGFLFDSKSGRTIGPIEIPFDDAKILAYDALGHRLVTASKWTDKNHTIDVWKLGKSGVKHQYSFYANPDSAKIKTTPGSIKFVDKDRIAVMMSNQVGVYDLTNQKALYGYQFDRMTSRKFGRFSNTYAFGIRDENVVAVNLKTGTIDGKSPLKIKKANPRLPTPRYSISEDLTKLVTMNRRYLEIYDLASGEKINSIFLPTVRELEPIFIDEENVLVVNNMGGTLVNVPLKSAIWNYSRCQFTIGPLGSKEIWASTENAVPAKVTKGTFFVSATPIPSAKAETVIEALKKEDLVMLRKGDSVAIDFKAAREASQHLINELESKGFVIDRNSPNKLVATSGQRQGGTTNYDVAGEGSQSLTAKTVYYELALVKNGEKVWFFGGGASTKDLGNFVILEQGETVQSKANSGLIGPAKFFGSIQLPEEFIKVPEKRYYGSSEGMLGGFKDK